MSTKNKKGPALAGLVMLDFLSPDKGSPITDEWVKMTPDERRHELEKAVGMHPEETGPLAS